MYCYCADPQLFTRCRWQVRCIKHGQLSFAQFFFVVCFQSIDSTDVCAEDSTTPSRKKKKQDISDEVWKS